MKKHTRKHPTPRRDCPYAEVHVPDRRAETQIERERDRRTDRQTDRQTDKQTDRQTDRQRQPASSQPTRQTDIQVTDRQTNGQTDRQKDRPDSYEDHNSSNGAFDHEANEEQGSGQGW